MKQRLVIPLLSGILLCSCSSTQQPPQWIDQPASVYPTEQYLTGVGEAASREQAANRALNNLSKNFSVSVSEQTTDLTQALTQRDANGTTTQSQTQLTREINTSTDQLLKGALIKESWRDETGQYFALALLEKHKTAQALTDTIRGLDRATADKLEYSSTTAPNIVLALQSLKEARAEQQQRELANAQLKVVAKNGIPTKTDSAAITQLMKNALASIKIQTIGSTESETKALSAALGQIGIPTDDNSNLILKASLDTTPATYQQGWYWLRGSYEMTLSDNDAAITQKRWPVKVSAKEEAQLKTRMDDLISKQWPNAVIELLSSPPSL